MIRPGIHVEGLNELRRAVRRVQGSLLRDSLVEANKEIADEVIRRALPRVPVRSGRLRASVRGSGTVSGAIGRAGGARVPYAPVIHWGSPRRGIPRRPFLQDAAADVEQDVADRYRERIERLLDIIRRA